MAWTAEAENMKTIMVLLAAGLSRRFGAENKLLWKFNGVPLYRYTLDRLAALEDEESILLVMTNTPEIQKECEERTILWAASPHASEGISHTIRAAAELAQEHQAEACAFFVADQPTLKLNTMKSFLRFCRQNQAELACVEAEGQRGNPTWFGRQWFPALCALQGDVGGRRILSQHAKQVLLFSVERSELTDIDRPPCGVQNIHLK